VGRGRISAALFFIALLLLAAAVWQLTRTPEAGPLKLTRLHFSDLPGWSAGDPHAAFTAFERSCTALTSQPDTTRVGDYGGTVADWRAVCAASEKADANAARDFFEQWFQPLAVGAGDVKDGLFTGYYEPELHGSIARHGPYKTPVYGRPADLVDVDLGQFRDSWTGEHVSGRIEEHRLVPYATRAEIDAHGLRQSQILFYGDDPVSVFFLHIQGSGRVVLDDGEVARVAYAGENGRPYTAIGRTLIAEHALPKDGLTMQTIRDWLTAHPDNARRVMESDASFVFFKKLPIGDPGLGAVGAESVPLTPEASIAVDRRIHPLGVPFFLTANNGLNRLFIAQDIGGAIRGAVRADLFFGFGPRAEARAGAMKQTGRMYVLLPKPVAAKIK
jgi:membrane-bound lytic murein transglycosylase A